MCIYSNWKSCWAWAIIDQAIYVDAGGIHTCQRRIAITSYWFQRLRYPIDSLQQTHPSLCRFWVTFMQLITTSICHHWPAKEGRGRGKTKIKSLLKYDQWRIRKSISNGNRAKESHSFRVTTGLTFKSPRDVGARTWQIKDGLGRLGLPELPCVCVNALWGTKDSAAFQAVALSGCKSNLCNNVSSRNHHGSYWNNRQEQQGQLVILVRKTKQKRKHFPAS